MGAAPGHLVKNCNTRSAARPHLGSRASDRSNREAGIAERAAGRDIDCGAVGPLVEDADAGLTLDQPFLAVVQPVVGADIFDWDGLVGDFEMGQRDAIIERMRIGDSRVFGRGGNRSTRVTRLA